MHESASHEGEGTALRSRPDRTLCIAPSILAADFSRLAEEIASVERAGADQLHVDVMDGHFVPNLTFGPILVQAVRKLSRLPLDVHLMIDEPLRYAGAFRKAGADSMTMHAELGLASSDAIASLRATGARVGVAINPDTSADVLFPVLDLLDLVLVMSVHPGFGGQAFIPEVVPKIERLAAERARRGLAFDLSVDGGIGAATAPPCVAAGANVLVAGSSIFRAEDRAEAITSLRAAR
jgi:ribulose-phosphate 3-epimerase